MAVKSVRRGKSKAGSSRGKVPSHSQRKVAPVKGFTRKKFAGSKRSVLLPKGHSGLAPSRSTRATPRPSARSTNRGSIAGMPFHPGSLVISSAQKIKKALGG